MKTVTLNKLIWLRAMSLRVNEIICLTVCVFLLNVDVPQLKGFASDPQVQDSFLKHMQAAFHSSSQSGMTNFLVFIKFLFFNYNTSYFRIICFAYLSAIFQFQVCNLGLDDTTSVGSSRVTKALLLLLSISTALMRPRRLKQYCLQLDIALWHTKLCFHVQIEHSTRMSHCY